MIKARKSIKGGLIGVIPDNSILSTREVAGRNADKSIPANVRDAVKTMVGRFNLGSRLGDEASRLSVAVPEGVGSFFQNAQPYSSDIDINTKININTSELGEYNDSDSVSEFAAGTIQRIVSRVVKLTSWNADKPSGQLLFSDFKCGKDASGRGIHWTWQEILDGIKQVDGAELTLEEVMQDENDPFPITKLDIITLVLGKYTEISMVYMISVDGKPWNYKPLGNNNYIEVLRSDTMDKIREGKYLKACKRIFSNARIKVGGVIDVRVCNAVLPLLTSNASKLAACGSSLDTIRLMADQNLKVNQMFINKEFVAMADAISSISDLDLDQVYINKKLREINTSINKYKKLETGVQIEELSEYITDKTSAATIEYLQSLGVRQWTDLPARYIDRSELDDDDDDFPALPDVPGTGISDVEPLLLMPPPGAKPAKPAKPAKVVAPKINIKSKVAKTVAEAIETFDAPLPKWFTDSPGIKVNDFIISGTSGIRSIIYLGVDITGELGIDTPAGLEAVKRMVRDIRGVAEPVVKIKTKTKAKAKAKAVEEIEEVEELKPEDWFADPFLFPKPVEKAVEKADPMKDALTVRKSNKGVDYYMEPVAGLPRMPAMQGQRQQLPIRIEMPKPIPKAKAKPSPRARVAPLAIEAPVAPVAPAFVFPNQQLYYLAKTRKDGALRAEKIKLADITPDMDIYIMVKPPGKIQSVRQLIRKGSVSGQGMYETTSNDLGRYATPTYNQIRGGLGLQGNETTGNMVGSYLAPTYKQDVVDFRGGSAENYSPGASLDQGGKKGYTTGVYSRYIPEAPIYPKIFGKTKVMAVPVPKRPLTAFGQARVVRPSMWNKNKF